MTKTYYQIESEARVLEDLITMDSKEALEFLESIKEFVKDGWYNFNVVIEGKRLMNTRKLSYEEFKAIVEQDYLIETL